MNGASKLIETLKGFIKYLNDTPTAYNIFMVIVFFVVFLFIIILVNSIINSIKQGNCKKCLKETTEIITRCKVVLEKISNSLGI